MSNDQKTMFVNEAIRALGSVTTIFVVYATMGVCWYSSTKVKSLYSYFQKKFTNKAPSKSKTKK